MPEELKLWALKSRLGGKGPIFEDLSAAFAEAKRLLELD